jgi:two-component system phosphate regulon sensor histidine kinase PhoR
MTGPPVWPTIAILFAVGVLAQHLWLRRRLERDRARHIAALEALDQRHAETEAQARLHQETLFNSLVEGVVLLDPARRIELANRAFADLFDLADLALGQPLIEVVRAHELAEIVDRLDREPVIRGFEFQSAVRAERWLEVNAAVLPTREGTPGGYLLMFHDVTRLKKLERTRQEFVANVSHELRTPLSMIKGYVESLLDGAKDDPALNDKFLRTIERHSDRLTRLIEDLLTLSEVESGRVRLNLAPVDLNALASTVIDEFTTRAAARRVTLVNAVPALTASADRDRIHQVLSNLVDNAIKYGREAGGVTLGGRTREDARIEVSVCDDGPGLAPAAAARVFERFYRVDKARSREQGGTGLGLAIVKHIVQSHGGQAWVDTQPGQGATFRFTLWAA